MAQAQGEESLFGGCIHERDSNKVYDGDTQARYSIKSVSVNMIISEGVIIEQF